MCVRVEVGAEYHERDEEGRMCHSMLISYGNREREKKGVNEVAWIECV